LVVAFAFGSVARDSKAIYAPSRLKRRPGLSRLTLGEVGSLVFVTCLIFDRAEPLKFAIKTSPFPSLLLPPKFEVEKNDTKDPLAEREGFV